MRYIAILACVPDSLLGATRIRLEHRDSPPCVLVLFFLFHRLKIIQYKYVLYRTRSLALQYDAICSDHVSLNVSS